MKSVTGIGGVYRWAAVWILFCAWCQSVPWLLSALGELNAPGYWIATGISLSLAAAIIFFCRPYQFSRINLAPRWRRWLRRAKRQPVFAIWAFVLIAAIIGGALYPPTNHDGLTYRFPRVLHWFWEGQWHWIENPAEPQMNLSTHGMEWLTALFFALTGSDRLFFLVNLVSFLLLPGLLFAFLTRVGVSGRVASWWMWLLPCGYGLALQAGSIGNDLFALPYALAGIVFALRARESRNIFDVALAILAAALLTGTKLSNAPLVLPIAAALSFNLPWVLRWRHAPPLLGATAAGLIASALPVLIACQIYTGHFSGDPDNTKSLNVQNPAAGVVANSLQVTTRNLMPPVNPLAGAWNRSYRDWLPESLTGWLAEDYPRFHLNWDELPQEENDGAGLGILLLAGISLFAALRSRRRTEAARTQSAFWIGAAVLAATAFYLAKMGSEAAPRLMLPYYALLLGVLAAFEINAGLTRQRWWRISATAAACFVLPALILSPNRPLVPVRTILAHLPDSLRQTGIAKRMEAVYESYAVRNDAMAPLRKWLPETSERDRIGLIAGGRSLRTGLWKPFGSRKVEWIPPGTSAEEIRGRGFAAVIVDDSLVEPESWAAEASLKPVATESVHNYANGDPERYTVLLPVESSALTVNR